LADAIQLDQVFSHGRYSAGLAISPGLSEILSHSGLIPDAALILIRDTMRFNLNNKVTSLRFYLFRLQHNGSWIHIHSHLHVRKTTGN